MQGRKSTAPKLNFVVNAALPVDEDDLPEAPSYLKGRAREVWPQMVAELVSREIYDTDTREQLAAFCTQMARWLDAEDDIEARGTLIQVTKTIGRKGYEKQITAPEANPSIYISDKACDRMQKLAGELGLNPVARRRVAKVKQQNAAQVAAAKWLKPVA